MADRRAKLLQDIADAGQAIGEFTFGKSLSDYRADLMLRSAVERQFEIVGEPYAAFMRLTLRSPVGLRAAARSFRFGM